MVKRDIMLECVVPLLVDYNIEFILLWLIFRYVNHSPQAQLQLFCAFVSMGVV